MPARIDELGEVIIDCEEATRPTFDYNWGSGNTSILTMTLNGGRVNIIVREGEEHQFLVHFAHAALGFSLNFDGKPEAI